VNYQLLFYCRRIAAAIVSFDRDNYAGVEGVKATRQLACSTIALRMSSWNVRHPMTEKEVSFPSK